MGEDKSSWKDTAFKSVVSALHRVVYGRPGRQARITRRPAGPDPSQAQPAGPWSVNQSGEKVTDTEPLDYPPLQIVRKTHELTKIYAELVRVSAERESRYKDYEDMILDATLAAAIELMVDDACQFNRERAASVWVKSDNERIRRAVEELFDIVQIEDKLFDWAYNMAMYGDFFLQVEGQEGRGVLLVQDDWHPADVQRLDVNGALIGFRTPRTFVETTQVSAAGVLSDSDFHDPWEFVHFRIQASQRRRREIERERMAPMIRFEKDKYRLTTRYGVSVVEAVRRIYKQLAMVEQSMIISRMTRAVLKYIYKVQCGQDAELKEATNTVLAMKDLLTQQTGLKIGESFEQTFAPMSGSEDYFLPIFGEKGDVTIETLGGEVNVQSIVDIEYLRNKLFGGIKIPKAYLGLEESLRGITRISMLDGTNPTIGEMAENEEHYIGRGILACDDDGKVHATEVLAVRKTHDGRDDMVRVTLDNGEHVDVTGDHKMMLRDGTFIEAKKLKPDDSLMPYYTRVAEEGTYKGYRLVKQNTTPGKWEPVYRMAASDGLFEGEDIPDGILIHHEDEDKLNDDPSNLGAVTRAEHYQKHRFLHEENLRKGREVLDPEEMKRRRAEGLRRPEVRAKISAAGKGRKQTAEHSRRIGDANRGKKKPWMIGEKNVMNRPEVRAKQKRNAYHPKGTIPWNKKGVVDPKKAKEWSEKVANGRWSAEHRSKIVKISCEWCGIEFERKVFPCRKAPRFCSSSCGCKSTQAKRRAAGVVELVNHKVVSVEKLPGTHATYDLLVASGAHTLPLSAGIFVHNSLPGSLGESALLRLDIRYARTVKRIQRAVVQGLTRLAQIHLAYKKLPFDLKLFSIEMDVISTAEEEERKASLLSALGVASDLTNLNQMMRIELPPKKFAKLVYTDVLGLGGKFVDLVDEAKVLPSEEDMAAADAAISGGMPGGGMPGEPSVDDLPPGEDMPPEGELEPPPEGAADEGGIEIPGEGELEPPPGMGEGEAATKKRFKKLKTLQERKTTEKIKRVVEQPARERKLGGEDRELGAGIIQQAKRQAMDSVTVAARHSPDVRAETPRFDSGGHLKRSRLTHFQSSDDLRKVLEFAISQEKDAKKTEKNRRKKAIDDFNDKTNEVVVAMSGGGKR